MDFRLEGGNFLQNKKHFSRLFCFVLAKFQKCDIMKTDEILRKILYFFVVFK